MAPKRAVVSLLTSVGAFRHEDEILGLLGAVGILSKKSAPAMGVRRRLRRNKTHRGAYRRRHDHLHDLCAHSRAGVFRADEGTRTAARNASLAGQRSREGLRTWQLNIWVIRRVELGIRLIFRIEKEPVWRAV